MTLKDIAKEAGVSISTVSRILNGNIPNAAGQALQNKVWEIARAGGYVPNASAQSLKQNRCTPSAAPSLACFYARTQDWANDPFFSSLTQSVAQEALKEGYTVKYTFSLFDIQNLANQNLILNDQIVGAAILGRCSKEQLQFMKEQFGKIVYTGLNPIEGECDQVVCDGHQAAADAVKHLIQLGHRKIGYIGETKNETRYLAYNNILKEYHIPQDWNVIANVNSSSEGGYQGARRILKLSSTVTAFFCMNDIVAIGAIRGVRKSGLRVPDDIAVISMDDIEIAQFVSPMLTTMHIPIDELGKMAAKILIDRIKGGHSLPVKISLPYRLLKRESCP